jgi:hypothetical protein
MMKRSLIAVVIFVGLVIVLLAVQLVPVLARMYRGRATGFALVLGSPAENVVRIVVLLLLGIVAFGFPANS